MASFLQVPVNYKSADGSTDYRINDRVSLRSGWSVAPYYFIKIDTADGLYGADISTESFPIPHGIGEISGDIYRKGKGIALSGTIEGRNLADLKIAANFLRHAFWEVAPRRLTWTEDGTDVYYLCRINNDLSIVEDYSQFNPKWTWTVGLRADDPRLRKVSDSTLYFSYMSSD